MSAGSDRMVDVRRPGTREVIVGFSPEALKAPFLLRCGALTIDYIVVVAIPVIGLLVSRFSGNDGARLLNDGVNSAAWIIGVFVGIVNLVFLPMVSGQTLGKMLTGIRIVAMDGSAPHLGAIALRQTVGYLLVAVTLGLGYFISFFSRKGRALQDYVAGTVVIYADRRIRK
ncbi:MAG TPA: RDD family protein [Pyrinomonadaceae bacterium]|nr:RDD family protein [Pyrinomonadaceae bacterium]